MIPPRLAAAVRPRNAPEALFELRTLPGEQGQVDWAHFRRREVLGGLRTLFTFAREPHFVTAANQNDPSQNDSSSRR